MRDDKSTSLPDEMKIANCNICMLADSMKDCKTCPFNLGLTFKKLKEQDTKMPDHLRETYTKQVKTIVNK